MGRPSKLTDAQWAEADKRVQAGESIRSVARAFGVAEAALRARVSARRKEDEQVKALAHQLVSTENKIRELPVSAQVKAHSLADELRAISMHLASAAKYGAATAHRLAAVAHGAVQGLDDADPLSASSIESIKAVAVLTRTANDASAIATSLLAANKDVVKEVNSPAPEELDDDSRAIARAQRLEQIAASEAG